MRADRHPMLRRLRVLLACFVMLWGAGVAVPPGPAEETALYAPRVAAARRVVAPLSTSLPTASAVVEKTFATARAGLPPSTPIFVGQDPLYLRNCALLL